MATPGPSGALPSEVAAEVPFQDVCGLMERVQKTSGLEKKKRILASFLEKWREEHTRIHPTDSATTVRLLLETARSTLFLHFLALSCTYNR